MPPRMPAYDPYAQFSAKLFAPVPVVHLPPLRAASALMMPDGPGLSLPLNKRASAVVTTGRGSSGTPLLPRFASRAFPRISLPCLPKFRGPPHLCRVLRLLIRCMLFPPCPNGGDPSPLAPHMLGPSVSTRASGWWAFRPRPHA